MSLRVERIASEQDDQRSEIAPYRIIAYPADYTLEVLHGKWKDKSIQIPTIQRHYVWTLFQASRLIESFLLGLPVPGVFFYKSKQTEEMFVIDGQQRLRSIFAFFEGKLPDSSKPFALRDVQQLWEGRSFTELTKPEQRRLRDSVLRATIVEQLDPKDDSSIFHIFERLNTGGTSLKPQEVRNCIHSGPFNDLLLELNSGKTWRRIVGAMQPDKRMRDVELILRFLALTEARDNYFKPMKNFLSKYMKDNRSPRRETMRHFRDLFTQTVNDVVSSLGRKPFHVRAGLNAAVYDSVMTAFALAKKKIPRNIQSRYRRLLSNESYKSYISSGTTDVEIVKQRILIARRALFGG